MRAAAMTVLLLLTLTCPVAAEDVAAARSSITLRSRAAEVAHGETLEAQRTPLGAAGLFALSLGAPGSSNGATLVLQTAPTQAEILFTSDDDAPIAIGTQPRIAASVDSGFARVKAGLEVRAAAPVSTYVTATATTGP